MPKSKTYPKGTKFGRFMVVNDATEQEPKYSIKMQITLPDGKRSVRRLSKKTYASFTTRKQFDQLVDRLNHEHDTRVKRAIEIRTAFIPNNLMEGFRAMLSAEVPNQKDFKYLYNKVLKSYFLDFFIGRLQLLNPKDWVKRQYEWGAALMGKAENKENNIFDFAASAKTIKTTVQVANRFMKYLHLQMPDDYPLTVFEPISKAALKTYQADRVKDDDEVGQFINDADWSVIDKKLPTELGCFIRLMYFYGLRRAEALGFDSTKAVRRDHLKISKQLRMVEGSDGKPVYGILKDKDQRSTPHWFITPDQTYKLVEESIDKKMHPDTFSVKWVAFMKELKMDYLLHDLRRTFITKALRDQNARDVQLAVGHANLETTMRYAQDDRNLGDEEFKPA